MGAAALFLLAALCVPTAAGAANGEQCAATSTLRGQFCDAPAGGFPNQAQCQAAYAQCLAAIPVLMHRWCVQIDQPNCDRNDDCPEESDCHVHPVNQRRWTDLQCHLNPNNTWSFSLFDVADCKCDCTEAPFPEPADPEVTASICEAGTVDCSACMEPGESEQACLGERVAWNPVEASDDPPTEATEATTADDPPAESETKSKCSGCSTTGGRGLTPLIGLVLLFALRRRTWSP